MHRLLEEIINEFVSYQVVADAFYNHEFKFGNNKYALINLEYWSLGEIEISERYGTYRISIPKNQEVEFREWMRLLNA